jgi:membrane-associated phospholipid phosphatase
MRAIATAILSFFILLPVLLRGQSDTAVGSYKPVYPGKYFAKSVFTDAKDVVSAPFRWNVYQWIGFTGVVGGAVVLLTQDAAIQKGAQQLRANVPDNIVKYFLEPLGSGLYTLPSLGVLYGVGAIIRDEKAQYTALRGVEAYLFAAISAQLIKQITHRHRPFQDDPPNPALWEGPFASISYNSFPSGHSATVFAVATVLATSYKETVWVPVLCYSLASLTAISRIYDNHHWASDVLVGSALGFAIGKTIMNNQLKRIRFLPVSHIGAGAMIVWRL